MTAVENVRKLLAEFFRSDYFVLIVVVVVVVVVVAVVAVIVVVFVEVTLVQDEVGLGRGELTCRWR